MDNQMNFIQRVALIQLVALMTCLLTTTLALGKTAEKSNLLGLQVDDNIAVRFFFQPPEGNYFHTPLILRVARQGDPRLNTAPVNREGRTAYVSLSEMRHLLQLLDHIGHSWQESMISEKMEPSLDIPMMNKMVITVYSSSGTAKSSVSPKKVCQVLAPLNTVIMTPRAHWEVESFRTIYFCEVPGFDPNAYLDHY